MDRRGQSNIIVRWSINYPWTTIILISLITILFGTQLRNAKTDTDPKNMLPPTSKVRVDNDQVETWFSLHKDTIVLGIVNREGIINRESLDRIATITDEILKLKGVAAQDIISLATSDNFVTDGGSITMRPILSEIPKTQDESEILKKSIMSNPLLVDRLISKDTTTTAIYVPLENGANGREISGEIMGIVNRIKGGGKERYYLAGDSIARDTFGHDMFLQMALFSPIAGLIMMIALYIMFRNLTMIIANMTVAIISIIWAMGFLIWSGFTVHIMSSMIPVFLMAISTDNIHIFNEFSYRIREVREKGSAIRETMRATGRAVILSDLTTAAGFASLAIGPIVPVKVFGLFVAFGTLAILLMSFTLIPAILSLVDEKRFISAQKINGKEKDKDSILHRMGDISLAKRGIILIAGLGLLIVSIAGIFQIRVNNNMISWFKPGSDIRVADSVMNDGLGGTSAAYLVAISDRPDMMKQPETLKQLHALEEEIKSAPYVGKTLSIVDLIRYMNLVIHDNDPKFNSIPDSPEIIGQYLFLMGMSSRPRELDNLVDYPFEKANIIVMLKSWDASAIEGVIEKVAEFENRSSNLSFKVMPAGIAYFNKVWNDEVLYGMISGFIASLLLVLALLALDFYSIRWGLIAFVPLIFTIVVIYGSVGWIGKDFDMPISVLSTLSLGLAVDFSIHLIRRFQQRFKETGDLEGSLVWVVGRPGKGIVKNAILFALGFSVMIFSSLTPYITVGIFMAAIMLLSALATLLILPPIIYLWRKTLLNIKETR